MKLAGSRTCTIQQIDSAWSVAHWFPFDFAVNATVKQFPGVTYAPQYGKGKWRIPNDVINHLQTELEKLNYVVNFPNGRSPSKAPCPYRVQTEGLYPYQVNALTKALADKRHIISLETGLGKTPTAIRAMASIQNLQSALIICPAMLRSHWRKELDKWWIGHPEFTTVIKGNKPIEDSFVICSYDLLKTVKDRHFSFIIADEAHYLMNDNAYRTRYAKNLISSCVGHIVFLTATPITNEPITIYNQLDLLWPERFGTYWKFGAHYCNIVENEYGKAVKGINTENAEELWTRLDQVATRVTKDSVRHLLPPMIVDTHFVEAGGDKLETAAALVKEYSQTCSHVMALAYHHANGERLKELITRGTDRPVHYLTGETENQKRIKELDSIKLEDKAFTVGTMKALNVGIDLTFNQVAVISELYTAPGVLTQLLGRFSRIGGSGVTKVIILVQQGTEDEVRANKLIRRINDIGAAYKNSNSENHLRDSLKPDENVLRNNLIATLAQWEGEQDE